MLVREGESGPTGGKIGADGDETGHASIRRALDDGLAVGIEVGEIKVAMGVDEQRDEDNPDEAKGKVKLENLLGEKVAKKLFSDWRGMGKRNGCTSHATLKSSSPKVGGRRGRSRTAEWSARGL